jgi:hypothetical protein
MAFLPSDFMIPAVVETALFRMRALTIHDAFRDYDAVMSSREHLWRRFGERWGWPSPTLTIEQNIIDLGWHQKEFQCRSSFAYTVVNLDESRTLGCVYIDPPTAEDADAEIWFWARRSELQSGLEDELLSFLHRWLREECPFAVVTINGEMTSLF